MTNVVMGIVAGYLRNVDMSDVSGRSGRIVVQVEICMDRGEIPWSTGTAHFVERRNYP